MTLPSSRILFICKKRIDSYGVSYGLLNSARFTAAGIKKACPDTVAHVTSVVDANGIDKEVHEFKPTHVIINALWVTPEKIKELVSKWASVKWCVIIHSKTPFLANEGIAFSWIKKYRDLGLPNLEIAGNSAIFSDDMTATIGMDVLYLPNIYRPGTCPSKQPRKEKSNIINIGCFGALRPLKNHMNQAVAAVKFADQIDKSLVFHINSRSEQNGDQVYKNLVAFFDSTEKHRMVVHDWMDHARFMDLCKMMDIGMQVSYSESFNIVSADMVWNGVPMVMGQDIDWAPRIFAADPNSTDDIVDSLYMAWYGRLIGLQKLSLWKLDLHNWHATETWIDFLRRR